MLPVTESIIVGAVSGILKTDTTITPKEIASYISGLKQIGHPATSTTTEAPRRVEMLTRKQAGTLLCRTPRAVDLLAAQGYLTKIRMPGRVRHCGFRRSEVEALIAGGAA